MVIKTEMIKTCPAPRYGSTPVHVRFAPARLRILCSALNDATDGRLNNGINHASGARWPISRTIKKEIRTKQGVIAVSSQPEFVFLRDESPRERLLTIITVQIYFAPAN